MVVVNKQLRLLFVTFMLSYLEEAGLHWLQVTTWWMAA